MWENIRAQLTPSRVVPLTAQLLTAAVGILVTWLGTKGWLSLDPAQVVAFVTPLVVGAEASIFKWQSGWQKYEAASRISPFDLKGDLHPDEGFDEPPLDDLAHDKAKQHEAMKMAKSKH